MQPYQGAREPGRSASRAHIADPRTLRVPSHARAHLVKLLRFTLAVAALVIGLPLLVAAFMNSTWEVEVRRTIGAPPAEVHAWLDRMERWESWAVEDPATRTVREGPPAGPGAVRRWEGSRIGRGRIELTASDPARGVWFDVHLGDEPRAIRAAIMLAPGAEGASEVTFVCRGDVGPNPLKKLVLPSALGEIERGLARALQRLAHRVEGSD